MKSIEVRKLGASLALNIVSRLPSIVVLTYLLPALKNAVGLQQYSVLLAALALGSMFTVPFSGMNAVGRRLLGNAYANGSEPEQADIFISTCVVACSITFGLVACLAATVAAVYDLQQFLIVTPVAIMPVLMASLNTFDNLRAAFNEHFITAGLQFLAQCGVCGLYATIHPEHLSIFEASLILQGPFLLSSVLTGLHLVGKRRHLLAGKSTVKKTLVSNGMLISASDGLLMGSLNLSVFLVARFSTPEIGAWYGTFSRLFQTVLTPVILVMVPLSGFLAVRWPVWSDHLRCKAFKLGLLGILAYSGLVGITLFVGGPWVIARFYGIAAVVDGTVKLLVSAYMLAIVAQKLYSMIVYSMDAGRALSFLTFCSILAAGCMALPWIWSGAIVNVLAAFCGLSFLGLLTTIVYDAAIRSGSLARKSAGSANA